MAYAKNAIIDKGNFQGHYSKLFQEIYRHWLFSSPLTAEQIMQKYFAKNLQLRIDGNTLDYNKFTSRIKVMRDDAFLQKATFIEMLESPEKHFLFTMHTAQGISNITDKPFNAKIIAVFYFTNDKIYKGFLNSAIYSDAQDQDFPSRYMRVLK